MKNKKHFFLSALCLLLALCLVCTGCGGAAVDEESDYDSEITEEDGRGDLIADERLTPFVGVWQADGDYEYDTIEIMESGEFALYQNETAVLTGYLQYEDEWETVYAYNDEDNSGSPMRVEDDGRLYAAAYGYFVPESGSAAPEGGDSLFAAEDAYYTEMERFVGTWYPDGDLSADNFLVFEEDGSWALYERTPGDAEANEVDSGVVSFANDGSGSCYADSTVYNDISYTFYDYNDGIIWGGEYDYYERME